MPLQLPARRPSKYRAIAVHVDGIRFASKREAHRYGELRMLQQAGKIHDLELQPVFPLVTVCATTGEVHQVAVYKADFSYQDSTGRRVIEDVKSDGTRTNPLYRLKRKMTELAYAIEIVEV